MFVTSHVLSGVLIGRAARGRLTTAFLAGVGSHLLLDAMPHWGCSTADEESRKHLLRIARRDGVLGLATVAAAVTAVEERDRVATIAAIAGALLLDLDKPCKHFFGIDPFPGPVRRLHSLAQNESPDGMPKEFVYGSLLALADAVMVTRGRSRDPRRAGRGGAAPLGRSVGPSALPSELRASPTR